MTRIIPIEPSIPGEPKAPDNTWRANYFLFFLKIAFENKKRGKYYSVYIKMFLNNYHFYQIMTRIIPITRRAKSARQYPESQKRQTIPGEPITFFFFQNCFENKKRGKYYSVYIKMFLNNYHFYQIMTRIIPIEPSIPGEPKARQYLESQLLYQNCF